MELPLQVAGVNKELKVTTTAVQQDRTNQDSAYYGTGRTMATCYRDSGSEDSALGLGDRHTYLTYLTTTAFPYGPSLNRGLPWLISRVLQDIYT